MIWKLRLFKGFLLSGDSKGELSIWDSDYGALIKTFNNLQGDINDIEVNDAFNTVYTSGVDSRVLAV
jgi:WD40 repeat protein